LELGQNVADASPKVSIPSYVKPYPRPQTERDIVGNTTLSFSAQVGEDLMIRCDTGVLTIL